MRLFLALDFPEEALGVLRSLRRHIKGGRPVPDENLHLTLAFLGDDVPDELAEDVHRGLEVKSFGALDIELGGIGSFGSPVPRAIWVGAGPKAELAGLHTRIVQCARRAGCALPKRRFQPHVTLARYSVNDPNGMESLARLLSLPAGNDTVSFTPFAFHLYRSHLGHSGPFYERLASYPFSQVGSKSDHLS